MQRPRPWPNESTLTTPRRCKAIRVACRDHQAHVAKIDATVDDGEQGFWQAQRDLAARDWDRALGAAAALEELADVLGVASPTTADATSHPAGADRARRPRVRRWRPWLVHL